MQLKNNLKPFVKWVGGKTKLLPEIRKRFPHKYERYFEPFVGGGAVFFSVQPEKAILVDINSELINTYCTIRDNLDELISDLKRHVYNEDYYYSIRNVDRTIKYESWSNVQKASRFIYLNKTCYNALYRVNSNRQFNTPFGRYTNPTILDEENLRACSKILQNNVEIISGEFGIIESTITSKDFVYFDPPYVPLSKTANFTSYSHKGFDETMQKELCKLCHRLNNRNIRFMLSNSSAPLVLELYKPFNIEFVHAPRFINSNGNKRGKIEEVLITNF